MLNLKLTNKYKLEARRTMNKLIISVIIKTSISNILIKFSVCPRIFLLLSGFLPTLTSPQHPFRSCLVSPPLLHRCCSKRGIDSEGGERKLGRRETRLGMKDSNVSQSTIWKATPHAKERKKDVPIPWCFASRDAHLSRGVHPMMIYISLPLCVCVCVSRCVCVCRLLHTSPVIVGAARA